MSEKKKEDLSLREEEDKIINDVIDEIWKVYNDDDNEFLDRSEMEKFIYITLIESGIRQYDRIEDLRNDENFIRCYNLFDKDNDGTISKDELGSFIREVSGL